MKEERGETSPFPFPFHPILLDLSSIGMEFADRSLFCVRCWISVPFLTEPGVLLVCFRDPNLHFVESPALAPPEVQINAEQQRQ